MLCIIILSFTLITALEAGADGDLELAHVQQALIHEEIKIIEKLKSTGNGMEVVHSGNKLQILSMNH